MSNSYVYETPSPMGWFYKVDTVGGKPVVYRCKLGQVWEQPDIYDVQDWTPGELRFVAAVIEVAEVELGLGAQP